MPLAEAVDKIVKDREALLTFYDFPAAHWRHLRTVNPIESAFASGSAPGSPKAPAPDDAAW